MTSGRRGRKRLAKPRHPGGQVKRDRISPTPEQEARREYLAGGGDKSLTGYPLGILLANDGISEHQHRAGCRYAWLYESVFGRVSIAAANYGEPRGGGRQISDAEFERREAEINRAIEMLQRIGSQSIVEDVCVRGIAPRFMRPVPPTSNDVSDGRSLLNALNALSQILADVT